MGKPSVLQTRELDYKHGYKYRLCGCDDKRWCGLGDLIYNGTPILLNVTQAEARHAQAEHEKRR